MIDPHDETPADPLDELRDRIDEHTQQLHQHARDLRQLHDELRELDQRILAHQRAHEAPPPEPGPDG